MSKIEVNTVAPQCGTTLTLGESGDTVQLGTGASQSGFGRTGTVDWQTTPKTATFTAVNGEGYFINSGSAITANLPEGSAGAIVSFADYARNFSTYNFTISPNGSEKIGGVAADLTLNVNGQSTTLVYVDSTKGWINIQNAEDTETGENFICASVSGACNTLTNAPCGNYKLATFKGPGNFTVNSVSAVAANNDVDYLIVAAGGGGAGDNGGGGGAGGVRFASNTFTIPSCAPANPRAGASSVTVTAQAYPIAVGGGGSGGPGPSSQKGTDGGVSTALGLSSAGGGSGGSDGGPVNPGNPGGSGGGNGQGGTSIGNGNTPPVTPPQGQPGGSSPSNPGGGGGGGGFMVTGASTPGQNNGGAGGAGGGFPAEILGTIGVPCGSFRYVGGGGGGGVGQPASGTGGAAGLGGGGAGGNNGSPATCNGTANTGGGGGGGGQGGNGTNGGSGVVVIRYKFQS
jgi:hypothetical protein